MGVAVAVALAATGCSSSAADPDLGTSGQIAPVKDRVAAPDLKQAYVGGGSLDLAALKGHVVVLNVFGSWCDNCQLEQPALSALAGQTQASGVRFVGIAERDTDSGILGYEHTYHVNYPAVEDSTGALVARFRALPVSAIPSTLVIDKQGREAARFVGQTDSTALKPVLTALGAEPS